LNCLMKPLYRRLFRCLQICVQASFLPTIGMN